MENCSGQPGKIDESAKLASSEQGSLTSRNIIICPSRGRPAKFEKMWRSLIKTSLMSDLCLELDSCDPCLNAYFEVVKDAVPLQNDKSIRIYMNVIHQRQTITQRINGAAVNEYSYHTVTNDDFVFETDGWDVSLSAEIERHGKYGIAYGNDRLAGEMLPSTWMVSTPIIQALGWLQLPGLIGLFGDTVWKYIGKQLGIIYYRKDIFIAHEHAFNGNVEEDETFKETNSRERYKHDQQVVNDWIMEKAKIDLEKIRKRIGDNR